VALAIEATTRLWTGSARRELLQRSERVGDDRYPRLHQATLEASRILGLPQPAVFVAPLPESSATATLGTETEATIFVADRLEALLSDRELLAVLGHELAHLQNNHTVYNTALFYLTHSANLFLRWTVRPATLTLQAWARRAEITCDRAALLCSRHLPTTVAALLRTSLPAHLRGELDCGPEVDPAELLEELPIPRGVSRYRELFRDRPHLSRRVRALELFASSRFYRQVTQGGDEGLSAEELDAQVTELLSLL
jgi:Zn-dependent protease with chaperone function